MKALAYCLIAVAVLMMAVIHQARTSAFGMILVEWQTMLDVPPYTIVGVVGFGLLAVSRQGRRRSLVTPTPTRQRPASASRTQTARSSGRAAETYDPDRDWLEQARDAAKAIQWPSGARLSIDASKPCPIELRLEQAPPERAKRAISLLGNWLASIPTPPRARIVFQNCPEGGSPRHHQASGALAESIHRGQFKTLSDLDAVDVMFHHPDSRWSSLR